MVAEWKQERPEWCPYTDCNFLFRSMDSICAGRLPKPESHDDADGKSMGENTHRWCIRFAYDTHQQVFNLQVNKTDVYHFGRMLAATNVDIRLNEINRKWKDVPAELGGEEE